MVGNCGAHGCRRNTYGGDLERQLRPATWLDENSVSPILVPSPICLDKSLSHTQTSERSKPRKVGPTGELSFDTVGTEFLTVGRGVIVVHGTMIAGRVQIRKARMPLLVTGSIATF